MTVRKAVKCDILISKIMSITGRSEAYIKLKAIGMSYDSRMMYIEALEKQLEDAMQGTKVGE